MVLQKLNTISFSLSFRNFNLLSNSEANSFNLILEIEWIRQQFVIVVVVVYLQAGLHPRAGLEIQPDGLRNALPNTNPTGVPEQDRQVAALRKSPL